MKKAFKSRNDPKRLDSYVMRHKPDQALLNNPDSDTEKTIIVKHMEMTMNEKDCQVFNFIDVTMYSKLKEFKERTNNLSTLNS